MNMKDAVVSVLTNWNNYRDRACRSEFWYFTLAVCLVGLIISIIEIATGMVDGWSVEGGTLSLIFSLLILPPSISVTARRLHDIGWSGWWQVPAVLIFIGGTVFGWSDWWNYLNIIAILVYTVLCALPATEDENKWGRNPLI